LCCCVQLPRSLPPPDRLGVLVPEGSQHPP
jgi:hypothetical protein